jgi:hypothetical protein
MNVQDKSVPDDTVVETNTLSTALNSTARDYSIDPIWGGGL